MSRENAVVFIGHSECPQITVDVLKAEIEKLIKDHKVTEFYNGGQGHFDRTAALAVHQLKEQYPQIKNYLVIPYRNFNIFDESLFDEIIYPFPAGYISNANYRSAIPKRNEYMIKHSSYAICYVEHLWGNAVKTYRKAQNEGLTIINLCKTFL